MAHLRVARRYAKALLEAAIESNQIQAVENDVESLSTAVKGSKEFVNFLKSPIIKCGRKRTILAALFKSNISPMTNSFLQLLLDKGRESALPEILDQFSILRDEGLGIMTAKVVVAEKLTAGQTDSIRKRLTSLTNKEIKINMTTDAAIIGGVVARIGDTVYDGSIAHQLDQLRQRMAAEE
jgi:F-type H+-transporting ATPase subunit delta